MFEYTFTRPRQQIVYALRRWGYYEREREYLPDYVMKDARILFLSLQRLDQDKFDLLKEKYYTGNLTNGGTDIPLKDEDLSNQKGITLEEYRRLRRDAESELIKIKDVVITEVQDEYNQELERFTLGFKGWFIKEIKNYGSVELTKDEDLARVFSKEDDLNGMDSFDKRPLTLDKY